MADERVQASRVRVDRYNDTCRIAVDDHHHMTSQFLLPGWRPDPVVRFAENGIEVVDAVNGDVLVRLPWCLCYPVQDAAAGVWSGSSPENENEATDG